jgi:hypothetical protein
LLLLLIQGVASLILGLWMIFCFMIFRGPFRDRTLKKGVTISLQFVIHNHFFSFSLVTFLLWFRLQYLELHANNMKHRVPQKSVNLEHSLILARTFRSKPASQFVERFHSVASSAWNMEGVISINFNKSRK